MTQLMNSGASWSGRERNCCFLNLHDGHFVDVSALTGLDLLDDGRALASVDWDGDGDLDLWFKNRSGPQLRFMRNDTDSAHHQVAFKLRGTQCNRDAIGAIIELRAGGRVWQRTVVAGDGYLSQSSKTLHFGLGHHKSIEQMVIRWPGGATETFNGPAVDRAYRIEQGIGHLEELPPRSVLLQPTPAIAPVTSGSTRVVLRIPLPLPPSLISSLFGDHDYAGVVLINLWAHHCAPCRTELAEFAANHQRLRRADIHIAALGLDASDNRAAADAFFYEQLGAHSDVAVLVDRSMVNSAMETIDAVLDHILERRDGGALPTSLLVDREGAAQIVYLGPVDVDTLMRDAETYGNNQIELSRRAGFAGRWYYRTRRNLSALVQTLMHRNRPAVARFYQALDRSRHSEFKRHPRK